MNYEQKYKEALEKLQEALAPCEDGCKIFGLTRDCLKNIFPELKESEDEQMIERLKSCVYASDITPEGREEIFAWLEKQDKRLNAELGQSEVTKTSDQELESKFHPGDWIVDDKTPNDVFCVIEVLDEIYKVIDVDGDDYHIPHCKADGQFHLWTIEDAKDGDVLHSTGVHNDCIFIFNGLDYWRFDEPNGDRAVATGYCCLSVSADKMEFGIQGPDCVEVNTIKPATKIQRDLLFAKMKEAGYQWDSDKKELKKIEVASKESEDERIQKSLIKAFGTIGKKDWGGLIVRDIIAWLEKQGEQTQLDYEHADIPQKEFAPMENKMLNADEVIEWLEDMLHHSVCVVDEFKKYFGL